MARGAHRRSLDLPFAAAEVAARDRALARASRRRAADVGKDARCLSPRPAPVPRLPLRSIRRPGDARASFAGLAPQDVRAFMAHRRGAGNRQPFADAHARGRALVRPLPRAAGQGQGRRACRGPRSQDREEPAQAAGGRRRPSASPMPACAPAESARALGAGARCRRAGAALRLGPAHLRGARPQGQGHSGARPRRRHRRHRQGQQGAAWCRCSRRCCGSIADYLALCPYALAPDGPVFVGAKGGPLSPRIIQLAMERLRGALGLPETATPHALRHSFATHLLVPRRRPARDPGTARPRFIVERRRSTRRSTPSG